MKNKLLIPGFSLGKIGQCAEDNYPINVITSMVVLYSWHPSMG